MSTSPQEDYLACVEIACSALDGLPEYGIAEGDAGGLLVLHGLAMYARDTARAAVALMRDGLTLQAGALTRVVIEEAVLAQWLGVDPDVRGQLFLQQSEVEHARWFEIVLAAGLDDCSPSDSARRQREGRPKNAAPQFDTVRNLFGDTEAGRQMYVTYRSLSQFVHPSATTFARYTAHLPHGLNLSTRLQADQDAEALSYFLASAAVMSALPYLDAAGEPVGAAVRVSARLSSVPTGLG